MSEPILAALTYEEWKGYFRGGFGMGRVEFVGHAPAFSDPSRRAHAIAAIYLCGEPFGFRREDVQAVRDSAGFPENDSMCSAECGICTRTIEYRVHLRDLADRIEALVPAY